MSTTGSILAGILSIAIGVLGPTSSDATAEQPTSAPSAVSDQSVDKARDQLNQLDVKGRAPKTGYSRAQFGKSWDDNVDVEYGNNNCPTNEDIKARDFINIAFVPNTDDCKVKSGLLHDPYSGKKVQYQRTNNDRTVSIDHIVSLSDAWQKGAQKLTAKERRNFANDPRNLVATMDSLNSQKGDGDAATWLPPSKSYRCDYAKSQIEVKTIYDLWVTAAEKEALHRQLDTCNR